jgi:hypothetical protein
LMMLLCEVVAILFVSVCPDPNHTPLFISKFSFSCSLLKISES